MRYLINQEMRNVRKQKVMVQTQQSWKNSCQKTAGALRTKVLMFFTICFGSRGQSPPNSTCRQGKESSGIPERGLHMLGHAFLLQAWVAILVLIVAACATVPHTGRRQLNMVSEKDLDKLALKAFNEITAKESQVEDKRLNQIVHRIVDRVSKAAETIDKPGFKWDVRVIEKDTPNAFCLPGGRIVVYSGIVPYAKNEAGLAAVIAHEVAHAVARHGAERLSQQVALKGALTLGSEVLKKDDGQLDQKARLLLGALGLGATVGVVLPYSRVHEFEADHIGQLYMARAGYDPSAAVDLWGRMAQIKKPPIPIWLSTHPSDEDRVEKLRESLPQAREQYDKAPEKLGVGVLL